jgi:hypothetical protein
MPRFKKEKPLAVCTVCGAYTRDIAYVNSRCNKVVTGRRCWGIFRPALGQAWTECLECKGYGILGSLPCRECNGFGWKLVK